MSFFFVERKTVDLCLVSIEKCCRTRCRSTGALLYIEKAENS